MKKLLMVSILITTLNNAMKKPDLVLANCFCQFDSDLQKSREKKESFFEKHPTAHSTIYGFYHGLGSAILVATVARETIAAVESIGPKMFAPLIPSKQETDTVIPVMILMGAAVPSNVLAAIYGSPIILNKFWESAGLSKPTKIEPLTAGTAFIAGASVGLFLTYTAAKKSKATY